LKTKTICKIISLATILLAWLPLYAQTVNDEKNTIPQPTKAINRIPDFVVKPITPPQKETKHTQTKAKDPSDPYFWDPYLKNLGSKVRKAWHPGKDCPATPARQIVIFTIHKNGTISDLHLERPSGSEIADQTLIQAVRDAAPFDPLPAGSKDQIPIQFTINACPVFRRPATK